MSVPSSDRQPLLSQAHQKQCQDSLCQEWEQKHQCRDHHQESTDFSHNSADLQQEPHNHQEHQEAFFHSHQGWDKWQ